MLCVKNQAYQEPINVQSIIIKLEPLVAHYSLKKKDLPKPFKSKYNLAQPRK